MARTSVDSETKPTRMEMSATFHIIRLTLQEFLEPYPPTKARITGKSYRERAIKSKVTDEEVNNSKVQLYGVDVFSIGDLLTK
ncbi:hypothetical protein Trydic_g17800 [Trypoxylus dichotomus]